MKTNSLLFQRKLRLILIKR